MTQGTIVRKLFLLLAGLMAAAAVVVVPAGAITDGELDGNGHPAVVLVLMEVNGAPAFRCTGTLIAPTFVITAGHCAGEPGEFSGIRVFAEADVQHDPTYPGPGGPNTVEATRFASFPGFTEDQFFLHDVGMIELAEAINLPAGASYGRLPTAGQFDSFNKRRGQQDISFTSVGYGAYEVTNEPGGHRYLYDDRRMVANGSLNATNKSWLHISGNPSTGNGGTCYGDSGGPNFLGRTNVIAGITITGDAVCRATNVVYRLDNASARTFLAHYVRLP